MLFWQLLIYEFAETSVIFSQIDILLGYFE